MLNNIFKRIMGKVGPVVKQHLCKFIEYNFSLFYVGDFIDPTSLAIKLRNAQDPLSRRLREQFSDKMQRLIEEYDETNPPSEAFQRILVNELNRLIQSDNLCDEQHSKHITLREDVKRFAKQNPLNEAAVHLNRLLLEETYPTELAKNQKYFIIPVFHPSSVVTVHKSVIYKGGEIKVGKKSQLVIEEGVTINANILIGDNCTVFIHKNSCINNVCLSIENHSNLEVGEGVVITTSELDPSHIQVNNGTLLLSEKAIIQANINVRFGGKLTIGKHTGISYGSEIRCEERIDIGEYVRISYGVCIYDTNTHSTDWRERRKRIEIGYPHGMWEETKPDTTPIWIGDDVWIGKEATILKGCAIGNRSIIGIRTAIGNEVIKEDCIVVTPKPRIISKKRKTDTKNLQSEGIVYDN